MGSVMRMEHVGERNATYGEGVRSTELAPFFVDGFEDRLLGVPMGRPPCAMSHRYFMAFDERRGTRVQEHFFHFMWGYLLPAASAIIDMQAGASTDRVRDEFVFSSCGPVMDAKTAEMARLLGIESSIVHDER